MSDEEAQTFDAFIEQPVQRRMLALLGSPRRRRDLVAMLDHFYSFDQRWIVLLKPSEQTSGQIRAQPSKPRSGARVLGHVLGQSLGWTAGLAWARLSMRSWDSALEPC